MKITLKGATVFDGVSLKIGLYDIIIQDDRIAELIPSGHVCHDEEDVLFDCAGCTVMPGMFSCHFHPSYNDVADFRMADLKHGASQSTIMAARNAKLLLEHGYTTAICAGAPHGIDIAIKWAIQSGLIPGPRMLASGRPIGATGDPTADRFPLHWNLNNLDCVHVCDGPYAFRNAVRTEVKEGADIIKLFASGGRSPAWGSERITIDPDELSAAIKAAHDRGKLVRAHVCGKHAILQCIRAGVDAIDHADDLDDECIEAAVSASTSVVPSMYFLYKKLEPTVDQFQLEGYLERCSLLLEKAHKAGVNIVMGDDFGILPLSHGDYSQDLAFYVDKLGINAGTVLSWATINGASFAKVREDVGMIKAGFVADLIVVKGNPYFDISVLPDHGNVTRVMQAGNFVKTSL